MSGGRQDGPDHLIFYRRDNDILVEGIVDGETVFYADTEVVSSKPVLEAAFRTWSHRAYPELTGRIREEKNNNEDDGSAFH